MYACQSNKESTHLLAIGNKLVLVLLVKSSWKILLTLEVGTLPSKLP